MGMLVVAVITASLLGSTHCVGMCGPLAMWASGLGESPSRSQVIRSTMLYHMGRLLTYSLAGAIAGGLGSLVDIGGGALGIQLAAARIVGTLMMVIGVVRLAGYWGIGKSPALGNQPSRIGAMVAKARPYVHKLSPSGRALTVGLLTTLLPCGWLYLFALVAAGTGSIATGAVVMAAFWAGTVPALTAMVAGSMALSARWIKTVPVVAAVLLIVTGGYTATGRGFASLNSLTDIKTSVDLSIEDDSKPDCCCEKDVAAQIQSLTQTPLPCCAVKEAKKAKKTEGTEAENSTRIKDE